MFVNQPPSSISARAPIGRGANTSISPTTQQLLQIVDALDLAVDDELAPARSAWTEYQSTRKRDAVYPYLTAVFGAVSRWKKQHCAKARSHQLIGSANGHRATRSHEPFSVVIFCTSEPNKVDAKTRSKWSRALRYAERFKPNTQGLAQFIKSKGGINECADQFSGRLR
jgi:hypothetical protein